MCVNVANPGNSSEYLVTYNSMATLVVPMGEDTISRMFARFGFREFGYTPLLVMLLWCAPRPLLDTCRQRF